MQEGKKRFSNPKKAALALACAGVALVTLGACVVVYAMGRQKPDSAIGGQRAQNFAFADAGVDPVEAREVEVSYGRFQEGFVYEVEFTAGDTEYEYKIDAEDGSVVRRESKTVKSAGSSAPPLVPLTMEEARRTALADAGVPGDQAVFTEEEKDWEGGLPVFAFKFRAGDTEYEYGINGHTGEVYSKGVVTYVGQTPADSAPPAGTEPAQSSQPPAATSQPTAAPRPTAPQPTQPGSQGRIGLDAAKRAALADAGVDGTQARFTKAELDDEDGVLVYELEFRTGTHEYEYEIHATTGEVYARSAEALSAPGGGQGGGAGKNGGIGAEGARQTALRHAGCAADEVVFTETELDCEDGRAVYKIEFYKDRTQYEYEIDAATGEVLQHEWERD